MKRPIFLLFILYFLLFADPPFIPNIRVSNDPGGGNQNETTIGIFGRNYICGGWNDSRRGVYHVGFAFSTDNGLTWSDDTILIEPTYREDADPVICIDDSGIVYYFFISFDRSPPRGDVFLTKSRDGGVTWGPFINVTPNSPNSLDDKPWAMIEGNNVFVTWYEYGTSYHLKFTRSTDRGLTWSPGVAVGRGGNGTMPFRGTDSTIYVGWGMQDVSLNKSTDMGRTWWGSQRTIIPVTWNPGFTPWRVNNIPCFGTSQDRTKLYVVFADSRLRSGQLDVFFSRSTDEGETWSTPVKVNDTPLNDTTYQFYPWLSVDPYDRIHVVWHDTRAGGGRLGQYYSYSTDFGLTWSPNLRISDTAVYANTFIGDYTACAADSFNIYALWCDARTAPDNPDIFFSKAPHALIGTEEPLLQPLPKVFILEKNIPNPFTSNTLIRYALPKDGWVNLQVFNSSGILVRTLKIGNEKSGFYRVIWDGCDEKRKRMPNGVYFYRLQTGDFSATKKMIKLE